MPTSTAAFFDVWVIGPVLPPQHDPQKRAELLRRIEGLHPVAKLDGAQFVAGARLRLRRGVDQDAALRIVGELQAIGATVEVEANRPPDEAILALDQFHDAEPEPSFAPRLDENLLAKLQSLDEEAPPAAPVDRDAATRAEGVASAPVAAAERADTHAAPIAPDAPPLDDSRFRPTTDVAPMELEIERPTYTPPPRAPEIVPGSDEDVIDDDDSDVRPITTEPEWQPVPGRIAAGALRKNPPVRIGVGIVAGLLLGWLFSQPYAHRAERRVAELRAQANAERYRPVAEAQERVRALDAEADDTASNGAIGMAVIWVIVGGATFAAWWRLT